MIRNIKKSSFALMLAMALPVAAYASTPVLSLTPSANGNNVTVSVTGADAGASVVLYYSSNLSGFTQTVGTTLGTVDSNGAWSGGVSTSAYGILSSTPVYALINGYQSNQVTWPFTAASTTSATTTSSLTLSQTSLVLTQGQSAGITITGPGNYYIFNNSNPTAIQATVSGNTLSVSGMAAGSGTLTVCSSSTNCANETVTVNAIAVATTPISIGVPLSVGQTMSLPLSGGTGSFYLTSGTSSVLASSLAGNTLFLTGMAIGNVPVVVCSGTSPCLTINAVVSAATTPAATLPVQASSVAKYVFNRMLSSNMDGTDVLELQKRLAADGYLTVKPNGHFGPSTFAAVKAFQRAHGLSSLGIVGPGTRDALNNE